MISLSIKFTLVGVFAGLTCSLNINYESTSTIILSFLLLGRGCIWTRLRSKFFRLKEPMYAAVFRLLSFLSNFIQEDCN